jgi:glucose uptake protein GlcU
MGLSLFAWLSVFTSVLCFSLGFAVYLLNKKETLNRLFMLTLLFNAYWAFGEFMTAQAATAEAAYFWVKVMVLWPFWVALLLHFTLVFTESRLLKKKITYVLMYLPAAFFAIIDLTTNWISAQPIEQYWGYTFTAQETMFSVVDSFWVSTVGILSLVLCAVYQHRVADPIKKQQAKFVSIGLACPVVLSLITDNILPLWA